MNLIVGFLAGAAASMGLGGGFILILYLTIFEGVPQLSAQAANLIFFLPTALVSMLMNGKSGYVEWKAVPYAAAAGVFGALAGTMLGVVASGRTLSMLFGVMLIAIGVKEFFRKTEK